jgi:photosystem I P700 chlorophyll a apoprotein A2
MLHYSVSDYYPEVNKNNVQVKILQHKEVIFFHFLSWLFLFLGFHILSLYIHNDVCLVFGTSEKSILFKSIFAQSIQTASFEIAYKFDILLLSSTNVGTVANSKICLSG